MKPALPEQFQFTQGHDYVFLPPKNFKILTDRTKFMIFTNNKNNLTSQQIISSRY